MSVRNGNLPLRVTAGSSFGQEGGCAFACAVSVVVDVACWFVPGY